MYHQYKRCTGQTYGNVEDVFAKLRVLGDAVGEPVTLQRRRVVVDVDDVNTHQQRTQVRLIPRLVGVLGTYATRHVMSNSRIV